MIEIPKIMHFYWGNAKMPFLRYASLASFSALHPHWEIWLWVPKGGESPQKHKTFENKLNFEGIDYYDKVESLSNLKIVEKDFDEYGVNVYLSDVHRSDLLRWEILSTIGGLWSDMDIVYYRNIDPVISGKPHVTIEYEVLKNVYPIGFMGSSKTSFNAYRKIFNKALTSINIDVYQSIGVHISKDIIKTMLPPNTKAVMVYPVEPISNTIERIYTDGNIPNVEESYGIHWFAGHPKAAKLIREITLDNHTDSISMISTAIKASGCCND